MTGDYESYLNMNIEFDNYLGKGTVQYVDYDVEGSFIFDFS